MYSCDGSVIGALAGATVWTSSQPTSPPIMPRITSTPARRPRGREGVRHLDESRRSVDRIASSLRAARSTAGKQRIRVFRTGNRRRNIGTVRERPAGIGPDRVDFVLEPPV